MLWAQGTSILRRSAEVSSFQGRGVLGRCHCLMLSFELRRVGEGQGAQKRDSAPADSGLNTFTSLFRDRKGR